MLVGNHFHFLPVDSTGQQGSHTKNDSFVCAFFKQQFKMVTFVVETIFFDFQQHTVVSIIEFRTQEMVVPLLEQCKEQS